MSKLICVVDSDNQIVEGSLGFFKVKQLKKRFPDYSVICLEEFSFPSDYQNDHYTIEEKTFDKIIIETVHGHEVETTVEYTLNFLLRKPQAEIDALPVKTIELTATAKALCDIDASQLDGDIKKIVEYLQHGLGK